MLSRYRAFCPRQADVKRIPVTFHTVLLNADSAVSDDITPWCHGAVLQGFANLCCILPNCMLSVARLLLNNKRDFSIDSGGGPPRPGLEQLSRLHICLPLNADHPIIRNGDPPLHIKALPLSHFCCSKHFR